MAHRSIPVRDLDDLTATVPEALRRPAAWLGLIVGIAVVGGLAWWLLAPGPIPVESTLPYASAGGSGASGAAGAAGGGGAAGAGASGGGGAGSAVPSSTSSTVAAELVVQAAGAVRRPGVYRMPADARVDDLVRSAGGFSAGADRDRVNLAAPVVDGERIWIPVTGEDDPPEVVAGSNGTGGGGGAAAPGSGSAAGGSADAPAGPVDLNTATAEQLDTLPGVGPATAAAILAYRDQSGGFKAVDDLLEVRGIGEAKLEQLRPLVTV